MRRGRRHKKNKYDSEAKVEINTAAMLDMAFQLLAFFILTFNPSDVEIQISMLMPPDKPVSGSGTSAAPQVDIQNVDTSLPLPIRVLANPDRSFREIQVGSDSISGGSMQEFLVSFEAAVSNMFQNAGFESVDLKVDSNLGYEYLIRVMEVCTRQKLHDGTNLTKISLNEIK